MNLQGNTLKLLLHYIAVSNSSCHVAKGSHDPHKAYLITSITDQTVLLILNGVYKHTHYNINILYYAIVTYGFTIIKE